MRAGCAERKLKMAIGVRLRDFVGFVEFRELSAVTVLSQNSEACRLVIDAEHCTVEKITNGRRLPCFPTGGKLEMALTFCRFCCLVALDG